MTMKMTYEELYKELHHPTSCYMIDGIIDDRGLIMCPQCFSKIDDASDTDARYTPIITGINYETEEDSVIECDVCGAIKIIDGYNN